MFRRKKKMYKVLCDGCKTTHFMLGKITGIIHACAGRPSKERKRLTVEHIIDVDVYIIRAEMTKERYKLAIKHIEDIYPDICRFERI